MTINVICVLQIVLHAKIILTCVQVVIKLMNICKITYVHLKIVLKALFLIKLLKVVTLVFKIVKNVIKMITKNV